VMRGEDWSWDIESRPEAVALSYSRGQRKHDSGARAVTRQHEAHRLGCSCQVHALRSVTFGQLTSGSWN
jgi:hypothetical protein